MREGGGGFFVGKRPFFMVLRHLLECVRGLFFVRYADGHRTARSVIGSIRHRASSVLRIRKNISIFVTQYPPTGILQLHIVQLNLCLNHHLGNGTSFSVSRGYALIVRISPIVIHGLW